MARLAEIPHRYRVAELGPGTGPITEAILRLLPEHGRLWACEIDPQFLAHLHAKFRDPRLTILQRDARDLREVADELGIDGFDAVISAIPFRLLGPDATARFLGSVRTAMRPGAPFVAVQYDPWFLSPLLQAEFGNWRRTFFPWNIPPATLLRADAPGQATPADRGE